MKAILCLISLIIFNFSNTITAYAQSIEASGPKTVTSIGSQLFSSADATNILGETFSAQKEIVYFRVAEGWSAAPCAFGVMYFDPVSNIGQLWYTTLLTAKATRNKLSRVRFKTVASSTDSNTFCIVSEIIELQ